MIVPEVISKDQTGTMYRYQVFGGWIVTFQSVNQGIPHTTSSFVPDANHAWVIE